MKLIKLSEERYIVVDESEIKEGDWMIRDGEQPTLVTPNFWWDFGVPYKKITHSTQPIEYEVVDVTPTGDAIEGYVYDKIQELPLSEVKELTGVVDVEKKMISPYPVNTQNNVDWCNGYQRGYNQALLEDNKDKKYTEEDLLDAFTWGFIEGTERGEVTDSVNKFSQSLQPKTEWEVEIVDGKLKLKP